MNPLKASFFTLGCRLNRTETAIMAKGLEQAGYQVVFEEDSADLCVINTCTVTNQSNAKCRKKIRSLQKKNPDSVIAVVGCFSQIATQQITEIGGVHLILGNQEKLNLPRYLPEVRNGNYPIIHVGKLSRDPFEIETPGQTLDSTRANLKIQDGCDFICSFCVIPSARGRSRPRKPENILQEVRHLEQQGVKEIVLTGVNLGTYRYESLSFIDILDLLEEVEGIRRIRISSIEPTTIGTELFTYMKGDRKVLPYLHLPLQTASDEILAKMRRKYTFSEYLDYIRLAKQEIPDICIGSDIIVGFPGESDEMFEQTRAALTDSPIHYFHVFPYAERKGTGSEKIFPKIHPQVIQRRAAILRKLSEEKRTDFVKGFHNSILTVLFEKESRENRWEGYSENYIRVSVRHDGDLKNRICKVGITGSEKTVAFGRIEEEEGE